MRIPFLPKKIKIHQDRYDFVKEYRGGGFMLIAGSIYWFLAFVLSYILKGTALANFYSFGGLMIPLLGYLLYKLMRLKAVPNQYSSLVAFSSAFIGCCFPILLYLKNTAPESILPIMCIINAAHLLILCWVHLDYLYFILTMGGVCLGMAFLFSVPAIFAPFLCLVWGVISCALGVIIHINSKVPLKGYNLEVIP